MHCTVSDRRPCRCESQQKSRAAFSGSTQEVPACSAPEVGIKVRLKLRLQLSRYLDHQIMFILCSKAAQALGKMVGKALAKKLQQPVAHVPGKKRNFCTKIVQTRFQCEKTGQSCRA